MDIRRSPLRYCPKNEPKNTNSGKNIKVQASKEAEKHHENISLNLNIAH